MKHLKIFTLILTSVVFFSCREDRTYEYEALTAQDVWIKEQMDNLYLWKNDMPADSKLNFFQESDVFFKSLLSTKCQNGKGDRYSYLETTESSTKSIQEKSTYGFDFFLFLPSQTPKQLVARIIYVLKDSPAEQAGLKRGDWISEINGEKLTSSNYHLLYSGNEASMTRAQADTTNSIAVWTDTDTLSVAAARPLEDSPFLVDTVYSYAGKQIGYLLYNRFSSGISTTPSNQTYDQQLLASFAKYQSMQVTEFILDLRYNSGGLLSCAQLLASLLAPSEKMGEPFCHLSFNELNTERDTTYALSADLAKGKNLNLKTLYVITGSRTASASEAVINGLKPYIDVRLIGSVTEGKNVASLSISSPEYPDIILHPIVAQVSNGTNETDYSKGLTPDYSYSEEDEATFADTIYALGDTREYLLKQALAIINGETVLPSKSSRRQLQLRPFKTATPRTGCLRIDTSDNN